MNERLTVFDTTLRDGEQAPGFGMNLEEKLRVAAALVRLRVDVIEAGFPAASPGDFEAVQTIAAAAQGVGIAALCRCRTGDIDCAWDALRPAAQPRLHTFLATSPIHRQHKLGMTAAQVLDGIRAGVARARELCADVEFSAEDASRTERDFLAEAVEAAIAAGATTINLPDTVGYALPQEIAALFRFLRTTVRGIDAVTLSAHCHDDLGLAVANSLAAVRGGARQVECTMGGIGERAGNAALEEIVMAAHTRRQALGVATGIDTQKLVSTARLVADITGQPTARNKAVIGPNAFAHEAGIHQHGMLSNRATYEIMRPEDVGREASQLVLGKHSGRHALRARAAALGHDLDDARLDEVFAAFKELADRKKTVLDADLEALLLGAEVTTRGPWHLVELQTTGGTAALATAAVRVAHDDGTHHAEAAVGDGPVDATCKAIARATGHAEAQLHEFRVHSLTVGEDAQGAVIVQGRVGPHEVRGRGVSTDIIEASARAWLEVVNRIERLEVVVRPTQEAVR
ncbi:MAG: 2-isopropylmalate synthase [Planctomycetota bacterium]